MALLPLLARGAVGQRMRGFAAARAKGSLQRFGERFLAQYNLGASDFRSGGFVKGKLGLFAPEIQSYSSGGSPTPMLRTPQRVTNRSNANLSTIVDQLQLLIAQANKMGVASKQQQEEMARSLEQAKRLARTEGRQATQLMQQGGDAEALKPLDDSITTLSKKIQRLTRTVDRKNEEEGGSTYLQRLAGMYGLEDEYLQRRNRKQARAARLRPDQLLDKNGNRLHGAALQSRIKRVNAEKAASPATRGLISSLSSMLGRASATRSANASRPIREVARPIIRRALGRSVLKSIPIIGAAAGIGFALERLVAGDVVGAGLEATSGLAGPMTAIPALAASVARDSYTQVHGIPPEQDPEVGTRFKAAVSEVEEAIKEELKPAVKVTGQTASTSVLTDATTPSPPPPSPDATQQSAPAPVAPPSAPAAVSTGGGGGGTVQPPAGSSGSMSVGGGSVAEPVEREGDEHGPLSPTVQGPREQRGGELISLSAGPTNTNPATVYGPGFSPDVGRYMPQMQSTFGQGKSGVGVVPDPFYDVEPEHNTVMYFMG